MALAVPNTDLLGEWTYTISAPPPQPTYTNCFHIEAMGTELYYYEEVPSGPNEGTVRIKLQPRGGELLVGTQKHLNISLKLKNKTSAILTVNGTNLDATKRGISPRPSPWDAKAFVENYKAAMSKGDDKGARQFLKEVSRSNNHLGKEVWSKDVAKTVLVTHREAKQAMAGSGPAPLYTISTMTTADALYHFAQASPSQVVCALNYANGERVGGGYLNGARAQEEELCRQFPALYTSLNRAKDYGKAYPFGPCTYKAGDTDPKGYCDVLWTPFLVARRANQASGYRILEDRETPPNVKAGTQNMALVSAAAPNKKDGEVFEPTLMLEAMRTVLVVPKLKGKAVDTIILGAWGCGAFLCDPAEVAQLFAQALVKDGLGGLYREVHFAIPDDGTNPNARIFQDTLVKHGVTLQRLP